MSPHHKRWLALLVVLAAVLRLWCFIGYGRGDDPLYIAIPKRLLDEGPGFFTRSTFAFGVNYRLGVAGGSRVHYALMSSVLHLEDRMIPSGWRLVREIPNTPTSYRLQPLRIWEIGG